MIKFYDVTMYVSVNDGEKHSLACSSCLLDEAEIQTEPIIIKTLPAWVEYYERHPCFGLNVGYSFNRKKLKVYQYDTEGNLVNTWESIMATSDGGFSPSCVSRCCSGRSDQYKGFLWSFNEN
jgi:hypothetical protein